MAVDIPVILVQGGCVHARKLNLCLFRYRCASMKLYCCNDTPDDLSIMFIYNTRVVGQWENTSSFFSLTLTCCYCISPHKCWELN